MTLEYRCSNCGELLQTTNADPISAEIGRLEAAKCEQRQEITRLQEAGVKLCQQNDDLQEANRRWSKVADERSKENCALRQQNERLREKLQAIASRLDHDPDTPAYELRDIARRTVEQTARDRENST